MNQNKISNSDTLRYDSIDDLIASVTPTNNTPNKFNYATIKQRNKSKLMIGLLLIMLSIVGLSSLIVLPSFVGKADILPITSSASNEKLAITSKKSSFFVKHQDNYYYSDNKNGVWSINLGFITGKTNIEVGNYLNLGSVKIHSTSTEKFELNRNYEVAPLTSNLKKYITSNKEEFEINIDAKESFFKIFNDDKVIYETNSSNNICSSKSDTKTTITCLYINQPYTDQIIKNNISIQDEFGNTKKLESINSEIVPINDFYCDLTSVYYSSKVYCYGSKSGRISIADQESIEYKGGVRVALPINIQDGQNKHDIVMTDIHNLESVIKLDFLYDSTPLDVKFTSSDAISINSNRNLASIQYTLTGNYSVMVTGRKFDKDLSSKLKVLSNQATKSTLTPILDSKVLLSYEEVKSIKNFDQLSSAVLDILVTDTNGRTFTKSCTTKGMEDNGYYLKINCN
jgi:hypothetical protein